jgi:hypothetical protein
VTAAFVQKNGDGERTGSGGVEWAVLMSPTIIGNLLAAYLSTYDGGSLPLAPAGWSASLNGDSPAGMAPYEGNKDHGVLYTKIVDSGSDTHPTIDDLGRYLIGPFTGVTAAGIVCAEFSGVADPEPNDVSVSATAVYSPGTSHDAETLTPGGAGSLNIMVEQFRFSTVDKTAEGGSIILRDTTTEQFQVLYKIGGGDDGDVTIGCQAVTSGGTSWVQHGAASFGGTPAVPLPGIIIE